MCRGWRPMWWQERTCTGRMQRCASAESALREPALRLPAQAQLRQQGLLEVCECSDRLKAAWPGIRSTSCLLGSSSCTAHHDITNYQLQYLLSTAVHLNVGMQVMQSQAQRRVWRLGLPHWERERLSRSTATLEGVEQALSCMASSSSCAPHAAKLSAGPQDCRRRANHVPFASCLHV